MSVSLAERVCTKCNIARPVSAFMRHKATCRECRTASQREYARANRDRVNASSSKSRRKGRNARRWDLAKLYGPSMTPERFDSMIAAQGHLCAICRQVPEQDSMGRDFYIDHCHETGEIRGILCRFCNFGLGHFRDNPDLLRNAIAYLTVRGGA